MKHLHTFESFLNEALARGLKPLLKIGTTITKKDGEDALIKLSDEFDRIDDEYAGDIASHLDMAIELMQDGYGGDATKKLKQFNKACQDVLSGKEVGSAFESFLNEANPDTEIRQELLKKPGGIGKDDVVFTVDDEKVDLMLNSRFSRQLDFQRVKGDEYYVLNQRDFDRFIDLADSSGFDVDYDNSENSVVYVIESIVNEGKKRFNTNYGVGKSKYVVNYHDGVKKHKDGSDFFDVQIFKNQKDLEAFKKALLQKGFEAFLNEEGEEEKKKGGEAVANSEEPSIDKDKERLKDFEINEKEYKGVLSTFEAVAKKQEAMGQSEVGVISLPGDNSAYELFLEETDEEEKDVEENSNESTVNEEYIESMDSIEIANALGKIETLWKDWKNGPMTEPSDIKPAQKELKGWLDRWFKDNIK